MRATKVELRLGALRHNLRRVREQAPASRVMAAIKADGYGHGLVRVARALAEADALGVACIDEALELRESGIAKPVLLLEGFYNSAELALTAYHRFETVVHHQEQLRLLELEARAEAVHVWVKVNSGMNRLGFAPETTREAWERLSKLEHVRVKGFITHLANADLRDDPSTGEQLQLFRRTTEGLPGLRSIANSAAILAHPASHVDWVRPGVMLYGISPFAGERGFQHGLRPVMSLRSELIAINRAAKGAKVGYGATWACPEEMPVGIAAVGYGDGYPRHAPSGTPVWVNGRRVPLIGRVSMDMIALDLRGCPDARLGDPVTLWGEELPVEEVAEWAGTIAYELLCGVTPRVRRVEIDE